MEKLGTYLQQQREEQDITIEELVARTRIPIRYIEAIEKNQFDQLPNRVSAKGFLRSYAACVGVEYSVVTEAFTEYKGTDESFERLEDKDEILSYLQVRRPIRVPFPRRIVLSVVGVVVFLLILVGVLSTNRKEVKVFPPMPSQLAKTPDDEKLTLDSGKDSEAVTSGTGSEGVALEPGPVASLNNTDTSSGGRLEGLTGETVFPNEIEISPDQSLESPSEPVGLASPAPDDFSESEVVQKEHILFLEAVEPSWVQVVIDDNETREALLQPKDTVRWRAREKFLLTLGNAGGVRVQLDGKDLGPFGPTGEVVHKEIIGGLAVPD